MKPVLKYPGAKWNLASWIIDHMPPHKVYLEPYFGSGAIFFNKQPSLIETVNDIDGDVVNLFRVIREKPAELANLIRFTPWARQEYMDMLHDTCASGPYKKTGNDLEDARRFLTRMWMAFGAKSSDRSGWRHDVLGRKGTSCPKVWQGVPERIMAATERLRDAQIECRPALDLIERYRLPEVLIYVDPPYPLKTRAKRQYAHEMTDEDHIELLEALDKHPGPVLLSGYACPLYDERLQHWTRGTSKARAEGGRMREEVLWINPIAARATVQVTIFDAMVSEV